MNDEKQVLKLAAERLLAVANGATMEESGGEGFGWRTVNISEISAAPFVRWITGHQCRIRPPAVAPEPRPSLPCPPRPTPEQVAAARMPDGRRVKEPTVCEVPNGRAWFADHGGTVYGSNDHKPMEYIEFGTRRWIAEPTDEVVEPWTRDTCPVGSVVVDTDGARCQIAEACDEVMKYGGHRQCTYDWALHNLKTHNGQPCGVAK